MFVAEASTLPPACNSQTWSPEHTQRQQILTTRMALFIGMHNGTNTHTQTALNQVPSRGIYTWHQPRKVQQVVPRTHTYATKTHKHPWSFSFRHPYVASHAHTHTRSLEDSSTHRSTLTNSKTWSPQHRSTQQRHTTNMVFVLNAYTMDLIFGFAMVVPSVDASDAELV